MTDQATVDLDDPLSWPVKVKTVVSQAMRQSDLEEREALRIRIPRTVSQGVEGALDGLREE